MTISLQLPDDHPLRRRRAQARRRATCTSSRRHAPADRHRPRHRGAAAAAPSSSPTLAGLDVAVFSDIWGNPVREPGRWPAPPRSRRTAPTRDRPRRRRGARRRQGDRADGARTRATSSSTRGTTRTCGRSTEPMPYFVALPTTAGTGSRSAARRGLRRRHARQADHLLAEAARAARCSPIPELTLDLPPAITAATGMDALTHNVESYLSPAYHPLCDGIALEGVRIAARALPIAVRDGAQPRRRAATC